MGLIGRWIFERLSSPGAGELTAELVREHGCKTAIDVGCGAQSHLTVLRPVLESVGVDSDERCVEKSRAAGAHDRYVCADLLKSDLGELLPGSWGGKVDLVSLYGVIEHFPKRLGYELLERCEDLARKLVVLETPNGFVAQGPELGNENMRHRSGWFIHDLEGLGYSVLGTTGTKYLRGYAAGLKIPYPGVGTADVLLSRALRVRNHPSRAFNLFAFKDVRGVASRLGIG